MEGVDCLRTGSEMNVQKIEINHFGIRIKIDFDEKRMMTFYGIQLTDSTSNIGFDLI